MTTSDPYPPLDDLRWLERLARSLVRDPNDALDLSQEALLAAERVPGLAGERRRRWLAGTLRNLSARAARSGARRRAREEDAARAERLPSPAELLARTEQHRRLLELVHELPGDYRSPLLLRYFEEAPVARIAEALDLPLRTVHTRLHRGLKLLRERLDADHPRGREGWMTALVPGLVDGPAWTPSPTTPLRALGWGAGAAVASVVLVGLARWDGGGAAPKIGPNRADALARAVDERGEQDADRAPSGDGVRSLASGQISLEVAVDSVLVLDADGDPLAGARVSIAPLLGLLLPDAPGLPVRTHVGPAIEHLERTGPDGSVEVPRPAADVLVRGARDGFVTVVSCGWRGPASDAAPFVVMAPAQDVEVRVRDADGLPPTELSARIVLDDAFSARFDRPFRDAHVEFWDGSYADGVLSFASVPRLESASLVVDEPTTGSWEWPLGELPTELWLEPEGASRWTGTLVDADAEPVAGSVFTSSGRRARADASGLFAAFVGPADRVWAVAPGRAPLEIPRTQGLRAASVDLGPVVLRDPAVEIGGVVVDGDGAPRAGLTVWLADATSCSSGTRTWQLESIAAGGQGTPLVVRTDASGRFVLRGASPARTYAVRGVDEDTALFVSFEGARANDSVRITWPGDEGLRPVEGTIVDVDGAPVAGARLRVQGPGHPGWGASAYARSVECTTDADGRFRIERVPTSGASIVAHHPDFLHVSRPVDSFGTADRWRLARRAWLRVELVEPARADAIELRDAEGRVLELNKPTGPGHRACKRVLLRSGRTPVVEIGCSARTLLLYAGDEVVDRVSIEPTPNRRLELTL